MRREDLMSPDLVSEIVLLGSVALMVVALGLIVVAAFTQPAALGMAGVWGIAQSDVTTSHKRDNLAIDNPTA